MRAADLGHAVMLGDRDLAAPLHAAGVPVTVVCPRVSAMRLSRYTSGWLERPRGDGDALVAALLRHARQTPGPVALFYEEDDDLLFVSRHREQLAEGLRFVVAEPDLVEALVDKAAFQDLAHRLALPVPHSLVVDLSEGVPEVLDTSFPVIVKPVRREHDWRAVTGAKAVLIEGPDELRGLLQRLAPHHHRLLVQQLVPGPETRLESYHVYVDAAGEVVTEFAGRKLRTHPASMGHSTALVTTDAPDVLELGRTLIRRLGLTGVAKLDFKRDTDGRLWLLEVNPRFNLWHHLGAVAGVNIPAVVWADLLDLPRPPAADARPGLVWCKIERDLLAARENGVGVAEWARWLVRCDTWSYGDPLRWLTGKVPGLRHAVPGGGRSHPGREVVESG